MMISTLRWRPFGTRADLDVDFARGPRNAVVTQLLAACRVDDGADVEARSAQAEALTLAGRIGALASLVARSTEQSAATIAVRCVRASCGESFELELPIRWLLQQADEAERSRSIEIALDDGAVVRLRRPTGEDQRQWSSQPYATRREAERAVLDSLLNGGDGKALEQIDAIGAKLEDADPLPALRVRTTCPACDDSADHAVDLEAVLLAQLRRQQSALLVDVHRLAMRYGWSEAEVAALPAWRRRAYLELSARDGA